MNVRIDMLTTSNNISHVESFKLTDKKTTQLIERKPRRVHSLEIVSDTDCVVSILADTGVPIMQWPVRAGVATSIALGNESYYLQTSATSFSVQEVPNAITEATNALEKLATEHGGDNAISAMARAFCLIIRENEGDLDTALGIIGDAWEAMLVDEELP